MDCKKKQHQSKVGGVSNNHVERAAEGFKVKVSFDYKAVYKSKENLKKGIFYKKKHVLVLSFWAVVKLSVPLVILVCVRYWWGVSCLALYS